MTDNDQAQICLNGHIVNRYAVGNRDYGRPFCPKCGEPAIMECSKCHAPLRDVEEPHFGQYEPPKFCGNCGQPFPWTETRIGAAQELIKETGVPEAEKVQAAKDIEDVIRETPRTEAAASRLKKFMARAGREAGAALERIITNVAVEAANKIIRGG